MAIETEQIVVEFIGDASGLEPAVDQLERVGAIDKTVADAFRKANESYASRKKVLEDVAKSNEKVDAANKKTIASYDELSKKLGQISKDIQSGALSDVLAGFAQGFQEELNAAGIDVNQFFTMLKKGGTDSAGSNVVIKKSLQDLRKEYRSLVSDAIAAGGAQTEAGKRILKQAGQVKDEISDLQAATKAFGSDTATFDGVIQGLNAVTSGFQIAQGAQALLGDQSEEWQETMVKLQGVMAITSGLQQVQNALQKESAFSLNILNPLQQAYTTYIGGSTGALKAFKIAFAAIGIGAIIIGITALVQNWEKLSNAIRGTTEQERQLADIRTEAAKSAAEERTNVELLVAEYESANTTQERRKDIIGELKEISPAYFGQLKTEKTSIEELTAAYGKYAEALILKATSEEAAKRIAENNIRLAELQKQALTDQVGGFETTVNALLSFGNAADFVGRQVATGAANAQKETDSLKASNKTLTDEILKSRQALEGLGGDPDKDPTKDLAKPIKKARTDYEVAIAGIKKSAEEYRVLLSELDTGEPDIKYILFRTNIDEVNAKIELAQNELKKNLPTDQRFEVEGDLTGFLGELSKANTDLNKFLEDAAKGSEKTIADNLQRTLDASEASFDKQRETAAANATSTEALEKELTRIKGEELNERLALLQLYNQDTTDVEKQITDLNISESERRIKQSEKEAAQRIENEQLVETFMLDSFQRVTDFAGEVVQQNITNEANKRIAAGRKTRDFLLASERLSASERKKINDDFELQERRIKTDAAKKQRQADIIQAGVNGLIGVTRALAEIGDPIKQGIAIANVLLTTALTVASIQAKPVPQFRYGEEYVKGPGTETSDSIYARLSKGERVVTADKNRKYYPALHAIHQGKDHAEVARILLEGVPQKQQKQGETRIFIEGIPFKDPRPVTPTSINNIWNEQNIHHLPTVVREQIITKVLMAATPMKDPLPQRLIMESLVIKNDGIQFDEDRFAHKVAGILMPIVSELSRDNRKAVEASTAEMGKMVAKHLSDFSYNHRR